MKQRLLKQTCGFFIATAVALMLVGCKGTAGLNGTNGTNGTNGNDGTPGTNGTPGVYMVDVSALSEAQWIALNPKGKVNSVIINASGNPVVNFTVTNANGDVLKGLDQWDSLNPASATVHNYPNFYFELAKLVPGEPLPAAANRPGENYPSKWVSYLVTSVPTKAKPTVAPSAPTSDQSGSLVQNADGTYTYTFYRTLTGTGSSTDILAKAAAAGKDISALCNVTGDASDVAFDATMTHRLSIEFYGNYRGTGTGSHTNTPTGTGGTGIAAEIENAVNIIYDFTPGATGVAGTQVHSSREIVTVDTCNTCHSSLKYHGAHRVDPRMCITCHTDQRKYGATASTRNADGTAFTGPLDPDSGNPITAIVNGTSEYDFPQMIHQIHMGEGLKVAGHDMATDTPGSVYNVRFPQSAANCSTCHVTQTASPQAANWKAVPSREACGGCHDLPDFTTGLNHGSVGNGGQQLDDKNCINCHTPASLTTNHAQVTPPDYTNGGLTSAQGGISSNTHTNASFVAADTNNLPTGAIVVTWNLQSVSVTAGVPSWTFNFLANGTPVVFNDPATATEMMNNFAGGPNLYLAFAVPQDGIATPNDWNASINVNLHKLWRKGLASPQDTSTLTLDAATGLYTATLAGVTVPSNATLITGGIGYYYGVAASAATATAAGDSLPLTQTNLGDFPFNSVLISGVPQAAPWQGGLSVVAPNVWLKATGQASRRAIVDNNKCNACHKNLGVFTESVFHAGQRNDGPTCTFCHNVGGVNAGWSYNIKEAVHSIHGGGKRTNPFSWQPQQSYWSLPYPAILKNCEACHVPGSYDFSKSANSDAVPNLLWTTVAKGTLPVTAADGTTVTAQVLTKANTTLGAGMSAVSPFYVPNAVSTAYSPASLNFGGNSFFKVITIPATATSPATTLGYAVYGSGLVVNTGKTATTTTLWGKGGLMTYDNYMGTAATSPSVAAGATYEPEGTTLVNSPITSACYACHDSAPARAHMIGNGGYLNTPRSKVTTSVAGVNTVAIVQSEQCLVCHGSGRTADIKTVHALK